MPLHVPVPAIALEGDYTTYTQKWVTNTLSPGAEPVPGPLMGGVIEEGKAIILFQRLRVVVDLSDGSFTKEWSDLLTFDIHYIGNSVLGKYSVGFKAEGPDFQIYKDGVLLQTVSVTGTHWYGFLISSDGRYIIAWDYADYKLYCYEGS